MRLSRSSLLVLSTAVAVLLAPGIVAAKANASSANISHSYKSLVTLKAGSLVSLDKSNKGYVLPANSGNASQLIGVAVAGDDSLLALDEQDGATQVATTGIANVLVSTLNGNLKVGDGVAVSPLNGVGMLAAPGDRIVGLAQVAFSSGTKGVITQEVADKSGRKHTVYVGYVPVSVAVGYARDPAASGGKGLEKLAIGLTGHPVPMARLVISLLITIIATLVLVTLLYSSIYGSVISIGRNPLAKRAIFRTLSGVMTMAIVTACVAFLAVFLLLH